MVEFHESESTDNDGPQALGEVKFSCSNCRMFLVTVLKVRETDHVLNVKVACPECGDFSFVEKISGEFYVAPSEGVYLTGADVQSEENVHIIQTRSANV